MVWDAINEFAFDFEPMFWSNLLLVKVQSSFVTQAWKSRELKWPDTSYLTL